MVQDAKEQRDSAFDSVDGTDEQLVPSPVDRQWLLLVSRLAAISDASRARADRLAERLALHHDLVSALAGTATPRVVASVLFDRLLPHLGASAAHLSWSRADGAFETLASIGVSPALARHLESVAAGQTAAVELPDLVRAEGYPGSLALPLVARGQRLGLLTLGWRTPRDIDQEERAALTSIASIVAQSIERTWLVEHAEAERRARAEHVRSVHENQALVDLLARAVPQIIWITQGPNVVFLNERWTDYTGIAVADTLARGWSGLREAIHPHDVPAVEQSWATARARGQTWQLEYRMRRHDGVYRWHLGRAVPQLDGGDLRRWVGTATDIDDLRRAEAEKAEEDAFRERLFGIAGHDLRNPLNAIVMAGALLDGREELSAGSRTLVARIRRSADRMTRLIGQLLDLSRIRSGAGLALVRTRVDLGELAREVADEARVGTPEALIAVRVLGDAVGEWDRDRLAQVVANLLSNAIQHGRRGAPVGITVDGERDPRMVRLEVVNEGDPIPEADRATLFEPWKRGAGTRDRRTGAGLGLYIVHGVVTAHGGTVAVESDLLGTRVCLSLPR
jgi:PAS domain S-box-containing protein